MDMVKKELNKAIINSLLGKYSLYIFQIISTAVLSRLFTPENFGVVAASQVFLMFFQMLAISGLAPAIVYQDKVTEKLRDGVFSFSFLLGILLAIVFVLLASPLYHWFDFDDGLIVFYTLAPVVFFSSLSMVPLAALQKDAKFLVIARAEIIAELIAFAVCIVASYYVSGYVALALKFAFSPIIRFVLYWYFCLDTTVSRPKFGRHIGEISTLLEYAKYQVAFNVLNFLSRNLDNVLIAKYFGASLLGVYEKTYQVMRYPLQLFTFAITPALQPILTKYKNEPAIICKEYFHVAYKLALVGVFSASVMYWNAKDIVYILFGEQWLGAVPYLKVLALSIPVQMVLSSTGGVFQAFGATKAMFYCGVFSAIVNVSAIIYGVMVHDILIICSSLVIAFTINLFQCFYMLYRTVFINQNRRYFFCLILLILPVYINLLFDVTSSQHVAMTLIASVFSIAITATVVGFISLVVFLFIRKLGWFK